MTPTARQHGFARSADNLAPLAGAARNRDAIGIDLFGALTSVDGAAAPIGNLHLLSPGAAPNPNPTRPTASSTHGAPVVAAVTLRDANGAPVHRPARIHLAFP